MATDYNYQQNINGWVYGYSDIELKINGQVFSQIESVNYDIQITQEPFIGTSPEAEGRTAGYATYSGSMTMSLDAADYFLQQLGSPAATQTFTITVVYSNPNLPIVTDTLYGCSITGAPTSNSKGGAIKRQFNLYIQHIELNGVNFY